MRLYNERGTTYAEVARELGVDPGSLSDWVRRADAAQAPAGGNPFQMAEGLRRLGRGSERLRRGERDAFKSERLPRRQAAVGARAEGAKFASILLDEGAWSISEMRAALHATGQGHRAWRKRPPGARDLRDAELAAAISEICTASRGTYGAPKVFAGRPRSAAEPAAPQANAAPDPVRREFRADGPNRARFADITYVRTHQGRLYLAVVMDIWSHRIVGWSMSARMTAEPADDALRMAIAGRRPPRGCIRHPDHGSQHASPPLGKTMRAAGIRPSMGSISSPWDNAAMESPMGPIKAGRVHARAFETREQAALEIFDYIECFYNRKRIHSALGNPSPEEFEARHTEDAAPRAA